MKILLVRLRLIGDVVLTTPLLRALRRKYPGAQLTYLVEPAAAPIVRGNPAYRELRGLLAFVDRLAQRAIGIRGNRLPQPAMLVRQQPHVVFPAS